MARSRFVPGYAAERPAGVADGARLRERLSGHAGNDARSRGRADISGAQSRWRMATQSIQDR